MLYTTIHNDVENYEMKNLHNKVHKAWRDAAKQMDNHSTKDVQVHTNCKFNILIIKLVTKKLKVKHIKSGSQKFRTKKYKNLYFYNGCSIVDIGEPQETETTITYPVNILYNPKPEKININMVISCEENEG